MKSEMNKSTMPVTPDIAQQVQKVIEAAPSRVALAEVHQKLKQLAQDHESCAAEISRLTEQLWLHSDKTEQAERLIAGTQDDADLRTAKELLAEARSKFAVIEEAQRILNARLVGLRSAFSAEVMAGLRAVREPLVAKTAAALRDLRDVSNIEQKVFQQVLDSGVNHGSIGSVTFVHVALDEEWFAARRQEGYSV